jgi:asparagine synthase (glutamine-hydrolysing)
VLTGEGADELFGGYPRYAVPRLAELLARAPRALRTPAARLLASLPDHRFRKVGRFADGPLADALLYNATTIDPGLVERLLDAALERPDLEFRRQRCAGTHAGASAFEIAARLDFEAYLVSILNRQDKMSMATSLESRVPFLDNEIIDLAVSLPQGYKQTLLHRKRVLRDVALRYLPQAIVDRRKSGFGVPLCEWFRGVGPAASLLQEVASSDTLAGLLAPTELARIIAEHRSGQRDNSDLLWGVLNLGLWRQAFRC